MKRVSKKRMSMGKKENAETEGTPLAMRSILFNHSNKNITGSIVVPETPNNSYNYLTSDIDTTVGTVLETPDSPDAIHQKAQKNDDRERAEVDMSEKTFESLLAKCARNDINKEGDKSLSVSDDDYDNFSLLNITPDLKLGRKKNVMSILESEHSFALSLKSQNEKNSSMVFGNKQPNPFVSPVKRKKRKSLAHVILPFDLNDADVLSSKLHRIEEKTDSTSKVNRRQSLCNTEKINSASKVNRRRSICNTEKINSTSKVNRRRSICNTESGLKKIDKRRPVAKSRMSLQFSDLNLKDDVQATLSNFQHKPIEKRQAKACNESAGSATIFFEDEELDLTAVGSINQSVSDIIDGLASQNLGDEEKRRLNSAGSSKQQSEELLSLLRCDQIQIQPRTPSRGAQASTSGDSSSSCSEILPTQPATILILQGVVAYVEVRVGNDNCSEVIKDQLLALGAKVKGKLTRDVTHVVFKDGSKATFNRAKKLGLHLVSSLWVEACRKESQKVSEALYPSGSMDTYTNPCLPSRLRKLKSMQPKDFTEEERIATARAERRKKILKSKDQSPFLENLGDLTPKRNTTANEDVNSPLFGISHLLRPEHQNSESPSSCEEETTFTTPLSKRLYHRFVTPQHLKNMPKGDGKKNIDSNSKSDDLGVDSFVGFLSPSSDSSRNISRSSKGTRDLNPEFVHVEATYSAINSGDSLKQTITLESKSHENNEIRQNEIPAFDGIQKPNRTQPRRSQRLSCRLDIQKQSIAYRESEGICIQSDSGSGFSENDSDKSRTRLSGSNANEQSEPSVSASKGILVDDIRNINLAITDESIDSGNSLNFTKKKKQSKVNNEIHQIRKNVIKKSNSGKIKKTVVAKKSNIRPATESVASEENFIHVKGKDLSSNASASDLSYSYASFDDDSPCSSSTRKSRGHKLLSVDYTEPSEELIVPTTPIESQLVSLGPYADLQIQGSKTQRAALRELKGRNHCQIQSKKMVVRKGIKGRERARDALSRVESMKNVFFSSDEEHPVCRTKIVPLPRSRKSIEDFVVKRSVKALRHDSHKINSSICLSSFHSREKRYVFPIIRKLGNYSITDEVDSSTTHVVCGEERRTLNVLFGIARGTWIIDKSWLYESLEMQKWAPEEPFELFNYCPGAKISREQRQAQGAAYKQTLFSGVGNVCVLEGCKPPSQQLRDLLSMCGCQVVSNIRNANIVVCNQALYSAVRNRIYQVPHISEKWILDSVQHHKVQNVSNYAVMGGIHNSASSDHSTDVLPALRDRSTDVLPASRDHSTEGIS